MEIFEQNSSELYWLAYLLTGNEERSVQAFSNALDLSEAANPTFDGFLKQWARKLVIGAALGTIEKDLKKSMDRVARMDEVGGHAKWAQRAGIRKEEFEDAVVALGAFPRCAMLLTIFEGMPVRAAAVLLRADEALTAKAQRLGIVQLTRRLAGSNGRDPYAEPGLNPVPVLSVS